LAWIVFGGVLGALAAYLTGVFRPRLAAVADALRLQHQYDVASLIAHQSRLAPDGVLDMLKSEVEGVLEDAKAGRTTSPSVPPLADRITALRRWAAIAQWARVLDAEHLQPLKGRFGNALTDVVTATTPGASLDALEAAISDAVTAQSQGTGPAAPAAAEAKAAAGVVDVPDASTLAYGGIKTVRDLDRRAMLLSFLQAVATFVIFTVVVILAVWADNDSWGTLTDQLTIFLVGAAAFIGTAAIQTMRSNAAV
jgi:hypothetical protein